MLVAVAVAGVVVEAEVGVVLALAEVAEQELVVLEVLEEQAVGLVAVVELEEPEVVEDKVLVLLVLEFLDTSLVVGFLDTILLLEFLREKLQRGIGLVDLDINLQLEVPIVASSELVDPIAVVLAVSIAVELAVPIAVVLVDPIAVVLVVSIAVVVVAPIVDPRHLVPKQLV